MKKKVLIGIGIFLIIFVAFVLFANNRNRTLSPPGNAELSSAGLNVIIDYLRPSVRDRLIFGTEAEGALLPHGTYWRLGANEPTQLTVDKDFTINENSLPAGTYDMYAIPGESKFEIGVNTGDRFWGFTEPDYELAVLKFNIPMIDSNIAIEQYTITPVATDGGIKLVFMWSDKM